MSTMYRLYRTDSQPRYLVTESASLEDIVRAYASRQSIHGPRGATTYSITKSTEETLL